MVRPPKAKAIERLRKVLDAIPELTRLPRNSPNFKKWHRDAQVAITHTFGTDSNQGTDFDKINYSLMAFSSLTPPSDFHAAYVGGLESATAMLQSMIDEIEEYWEEAKQSSTAFDTGRSISKSGSEVFVVHGHDEYARESVVRFLETLQLKPVVLHEQPNRGHTIIEKFEDHADVGFAVVLLTADDVGALAENKDELKPRARQNVILELGFFLGTLGRDRVCPFVKGDVETPSDYDGVVYTKLDDAGGWKTRLIQELKVAGFDIDANRAFQT